MERGVTLYHCVKASCCWLIAQVLHTRLRLCSDIMENAKMHRDCREGGRGSPEYACFMIHYKCLWSYFKNLQSQNTYYNSLHILKENLCALFDTEVEARWESVGCALFIDWYNDIHWFIYSLILHLKESMVCPESVSLCPDHAFQMFFMLFSWLFRMRQKQLCIASFALLVFSCQLSFKLCVLDLIWVKIPAAKVRRPRSCDMEPGDGWNSQADLWIKKYNSERLPQKPIS